MAYTAQVKLGPELISNAREAWLGYYVFAGLALAFLGGGYALLRMAGWQGPEYWLGLAAVLLLALVSAGISVMCHLFGHVLDILEAPAAGGGEGVSR